MGGCFSETESHVPESVHPQLFPMYLLKVSDLLQMEGPPEPHDVVKQRGLLHEWQPGMFTIFLSHQWLGRAHPDPTGFQISIFRDVLKRLIEGSLQVENDMISQMQTKSTTSSVERAANGYVFLDWFAIPQITARSVGVNEAATMSSAAKAVESIPFYVEVSDLFVALVPEARHESGGICNYTTWLTRGWCRAELWCRLLSQKPDTGVIVVHSCLEVKLMFPLDWQDNAIIDGDFTVPEDREVVVKLGERAVKSKIHHLSLNGPRWLYRFYLARQGKLLGQPLSWDVSSFPQHFGYESIEMCVSETSCMTPLMCATLASDCNMVRRLVAHRADVNLRVKNLAPLGYYDGQTLLMIALKTRQSVELLATLVEQRADVHATAPSGATVPCFVRNRDAAQFVVDAGADPSRMCGPMFLPPLAAVGAMGCVDCVKIFLAARCDVNPKLQGGVGHTPLHHAVLFSRGNRFAVENVRMLLEQRADVNAEAMQTGAIRVISLLAQVYVSVFGRAPLAYKAAAFMAKATPLGEAAWTGHLEVVQLLLEAKADHSSNETGHTPEDIARMNGHFHLLPYLSVFSV